MQDFNLGKEIFLKLTYDHLQSEESKDKVLTSTECELKLDQYNSQFCFSWIGVLGLLAKTDPQYK